jgi:predicted dehydrogenase
MARKVGVAVVGFGWMGRVHTQAYARLPHHFPHLSVRPELVTVADEVPGRAADAAARYGFTAATEDWRQVVTDQRVHAVSITAPNFLHREIGVAMAQAGKHIWIEKPAGLSAADTRAVREAVREAAVHATVGFNYRNAPAVAAARELIASGEIGAVTHARFRLLSDYAAHPDGALTCSARSTRSSPTPPRSSPPAPARPPPPPGTCGPRAARRARSRTRTTSRACCASPLARAASSRPAVSQSASRTTTASRSTAPGAR